MTLRKKAFLIVTGTALALVLTLFFLGRTIILGGVLRVEEETVTMDILRIIDALHADLDKIESSCRDWANWDDTYRFMEDRNPGYLEANLADENFRSLNIELMAFVDTRGSIVHVKSVDSASGEDLPELTRSLAVLLEQEPGVLLSGSRNRKGILRLPGTNLLVATVPILTSSWSGPARGTLIFARLLDTAQISRLARVAHLEASIKPLADANIPAGVLAAVQAVSESAPVTVWPLGPRKVVGYTILEDVSGRPALLLSVEELRAVYVQGVRSLSYFLGALLLTGLAFGVLVIVLLERQVLSRLLMLSHRVREIGGSRDLSQRVDVSGSDELTDLAKEVNATLGQLQESETALRHARDELEERVRERTEELEAANESLHGQIRERVRAEDALRQVKEELELQNVELRKLDRMKDALISDVSHELRTPVAKHAMQLEILRGKLSRRGLEDDLGDLLQVMENSVRRQRSVISNILTLSRLETGGRVCCFSPVQISEILDEVLGDYRHALEAYDIAVSCDVPPLSISSDRELLWHVLSNLVNNAIKYRGSQAPRIDIAATSENGCIRLRIADNGIGLGTEALTRVFERFHQESASVEGIGLGLNIVRLILDRLGGMITLTSPGVGQGSMAEVVLPVDPGAVVGSAPP